MTWASHLASNRHPAKKFKHSLGSNLNLKVEQPEEEVDGGEGKVEGEEEHQEEHRHQELHEIEELLGGVDWL